MSNKSLTTLKLDENNSISILTLNSPKNLNALSRQMVNEIITNLDRVKNADWVKVLMIQSSVNKSFCCGADIKDFVNHSYSSKTLLSNHLRDLQVAFIEFNKIVISCVNGIAFGGGFELALLADIVCASQDAKFSFPEVKLGLFPGIAGTLIARTVGRYQAARMILTGDVYSAKQLANLGKK